MFNVHSPACTAAAATFLFASTAFATPQAPRVTTLVGLVTAQGDQLCDGSGRDKWVNRHHQAGFVRLVEPAIKLARFENMPTILTGRIVPDWRPPKVKQTGDCGPPMQMRADWQAGMSGTRVRRSPRPGFAAFKASAARKWSAIGARLVGGTVVIKLRNDLGVDLKQLTLQLHYEGCYGKPGSMVRSQTRALVRRGATIEVAFPTLARQKIRGDNRAHTAAALTLTSANKALAFDFNWSLWRAGVRVACPKRER